MMPSSALDWDTVQGYADAFLAQGIFALRNRPVAEPADVRAATPGNYLFSLADQPMYIGEGSNLGARLRQQLNVRTSTFHKNYLKTEPADPAPITAFTLQSMTTWLGRKEIEDFGIANIPTPLNRFQLDKRPVREAATSSEAWSRIQDARDDLLSQGEDRFRSSPQTPMLTAAVPPRPGLYALRSGSPARVVYIGESSDLRARHKTHCTQTYFSALRRNIGTGLLGFELREMRGKRRYFTDDEDRRLTVFLGGCQYQYMEVAVGRLELEERLIRHETPKGNRKGIERESVQV